ncbi:protein translocase subunit SecD [Haliangium sp.]|uniref:protein translocase subunit SecD n=1 Tax=Haliangium sp. TaxID=2663208 RepID=UPI003D0A797F
MDRKIRWRTFWLGALVLLAVCTLLPTLTPSNSLPRWFESLFSKKVQLGLDLQGGLYVVYSIDLDRAVEDKASELKRDIEAKLAEQQIAGRVSTPSTPVGSVVVIPDDAADRDRIDAQFLSDYAEVIDLPPCPPEQPAAAVCIQVAATYADDARKSALEQAILTVRDRINQRGVAEPSVKQKGNQIVVELPGLDKEETERVKDLIERTARLEFKMVDENASFMRKLYGHVTKDPTAESLGITVGEDFWAHDDSGKNFRDYYLRAPKEEEQWLSIEEAKEQGCWTRDKSEIQGKVMCAISGRQKIEQYLETLAAENPELQIDDDHQIGYELVSPDTIPGEEERQEYWRTFYLWRAVELSGSSVADAYKYWDPTTNRPAVLVVFNRYGGRRFGEMTSKNVGKKMAIILDNKVNSAPVIQDAITGGRSTITMGGNSNAAIEREADDLVSVLKTGSLPAPLREETSSTIGPLLGSDAIARAETSFLLGSLLVLIIMVVMYRVAGWLSMLALVLNIGFMMAALATLGATLTLPGIAAIVLTVGMAVDANIIIYERVREELRAGKSIRGAVDAGFKHGFSAILDGQLTTAVAGYVLLQYGSGPIRGFAVMLIIGIACTLFTATWCTRLFFEYYVGKGRKASKIAI